MRDFVTETGPSTCAADTVAAPTEIEVFHEGGRVRLKLVGTNGAKAFMVPLRNGFPLHAPDRRAQCIAISDESGFRVGVAIKLPYYGLRAAFFAPPGDGNYFIKTRTQVGRA